jgi:hypothetical protein
MKARTMCTRVWRMVVGGGVALLLLAGMAGAQPFLGLPGCLQELNACEADLGICTTDLGTCEGDLGTCEGDLGTCEADLAAAQQFPATGQTTPYGTGSDGDVQAGAALSYTDNGDGTITDNNTHLMWEKKDDNNSGGIHDQDNTYTWCGDFPCGSNDMVGTIKTEFLDTLNDVAGGGASCFAGYCDWRVPNVKELQSIVDYEVSFPAVDSTFHKSATCTGCMDVTQESCSCTAAANYWSSTSDARFPTFAWGVDFTFGGVFGPGKDGSLRVRAVRGGQ